MTVRRLMFVFASLKLRLLRNGLQTPAQAIILVLVLLLAVVVSILGFATFAAARTQGPVTQRNIAVGGFGLIWTAWTFAPLATGGVDDSIDPTRLALLPLTRRQRLVGQTVGGLIGVGSIGAMVALFGVPVGFAPAAPGAVLVVGATMVLALLSFATSRALSVILMRAQSSRVGRDVVSAMAALVGLSAWFGLQTIGAAIETDVASSAVEIMRWLPPGWLGHAVYSMSQPSPGLWAVGVASLEIAGGAVLALGALGWWIVGTERLLNEPTGVQGPVRVRGGAPLFRRVLSVLARTAGGAAVAKALLGMVRVPAHRTRLIGLGVVALVPPLLSRLSDGPQVPWAFFLPLMLSTTFNQFGLDGHALWIEVATSVPARILVFARSVPAAVELSVYAMTLELASRVIGGPGAGPVAAFVPGLIGVVVGVGTLTSQIAPAPLPDSSNPFANRNANAGAGCLGGLVVAGSMGAVGVIAAPVIALGLVTSDLSSLVRIPAALGAALYGLGVWSLGVRLAARRMSGNEAELIAKVATRIGS